MLALEGRADGQVGVTIVSDSEIGELNNFYRHHSGPTDVLAFAMGEGEYADVNPDLLGDVVVSAETARRQASQEGHSLGVELVVLAIHGTYHLLGYDHEKDDGEMAAKEKKALELLMADGEI